MAAAFQQQIFALDARFNAYRAPNNPSFKTLYIRRRSQLLRENAKFNDIETIRKYINVRSQLLQRRYGVQDNISICSASSRPRSSSKASVAVDELPNINKKTKEELSISENYAFSGVHHIFDQHAAAVTVVKFANNDRSKLCCCSEDGSVSVCDVTASPPAVTFVLRGHSQPVTDCDWSSSNELLVTAGRDGRAVLWAGGRAIRSLPPRAAPRPAPLRAVAFRPSNNNMLIIGNERGMVQVLNISTGIYPKGGCSVIGGQVTAIACESSGRMFWAANDKGMVVSYGVDVAGALSKLRRCAVGGAVTCLSWSPWLARRPALLLNACDNSLYLFRIADREGSLVLTKRFEVAQTRHAVRSTFCPIMSFGRGVCVATGSEDCCVYFLDVGSSGPPVNKLQGHAAPVLGVSFSYDESLLATSDISGLVIIWRRS